MKVEFYRPNIGPEEKQKVLECLDGIFLTTGSYVKEFEEKFAEYLGAKYAVGLTSCTAALHLSVLALGIGPGDEIITTPMTFIATATAVMHTGAKPVFVDVEPETGLLDCSRVESAITERTRAVIPVHLYGQMCDMKKIKNIADKNNLKIIEDAAHCIEGVRDGIKPGQIGDVACFSFYATKNITSGEGGAIVTNNKEIAEKVKMLRQHGMSKEAAERYSGNYEHWDMVECGWKYNMDNIHASILLPQLKRIRRNWDLRRRLHSKYLEGIKENAKGVECPSILSQCKSSYHLFTIWVDKELRDNILSDLRDRGVGVTVNYRAIHLLKYFREKFGYKRGMFPNAEQIGESTISLPFYPSLPDDDANYVLQALDSALARYRYGKLAR